MKLNSLLRKGLPKKTKFCLNRNKIYNKFHLNNNEIYINKFHLNNNEIYINKFHLNITLYQILNEVYNSIFDIIIYSF